ncbi:MAG: hypothetical protein LVQ64_05595 [Thermoplasmatales archaeon]|nr:hypothetical protein [Thermoplasmatales archaeon]
MGRLALVLDPEKGLYSAPVMILRGRTSLSTTFPEATNFEMYVDTGSTITSISEDIARKLGLDLSQFPREHLGGIGGIRMPP